MARIAGVNIPQNKLVHIGLTYIYGIGDKFSNQICSALEIQKSTRVNQLIFDGYPRTIKQAKNLDIILGDSNQKIDFIFFLNVDKNTIIKRIERRKIVEKRSDDDLNTILKRYDTYMETTRPVLDFYSSRSYFYEIDGSEKIEVISSKIEQIITV